MTENEGVAQPTATLLVRSLMPTFTAHPPTLADVPQATATPVAPVANRGGADQAPNLAPTATVAPTVAPMAIPVHGGTVGRRPPALHGYCAGSQIDQLNAQFYPDSNRVPARYDIDRYQIYFQTLNESDQIISVRRDLFPQ
ncbi:MAG: hypothetical protein R3E79_01065 [Caldilineaceae bacterium]